MDVIVEENKFLLYVIECIWRKCKKGEYPINLELLNLEFLEKNKFYLLKNGSQIFSTITDLYNINLTLNEKLS